MPAGWPGPDPALLLPLVIVLPAMLAVLALTPFRRGPRVIALVAPVATGLALIPLAVAVAEAGPLATALGGWGAPLGIVLRADGLAVAFLAMTALVMAGIAGAVSGDASSPGARPFWALLLFLWSGLNAVFLSRDLFNLYVALELTGLGGVAMVALSGSAVALRAQMRYLLLATLGSLLYLMGVALLYGELGTLDLVLVAERIGPTPPALTAAALMTLGLLLKTAIWPLHIWLPPAHSSAPPPVSAALSALVVKASLYLLVRLWFDVFPALPDAAVRTLLGALGAGAVLWGSVVALQQARLKLMIAYSTVAQLGYMMFVFPLAVPGGVLARQAWHGAILQMLSHGLAKAAMFLAAGAMAAALGSDRREALAGGTRRVPVPLFALALAGLSVMALPPSGGFLAKWLLLRAAIGAGEWWLAIVLVAGGLLAAAYLLRFLLPAFAPVPKGVAVARLDTGPLGLAALFLALLSVLLGVSAEPLFRLLDPAVPGNLGDPA